MATWIPGFVTAEECGARVSMFPAPPVSFSLALNETATFEVVNVGGDAFRVVGVTGACLTFAFIDSSSTCPAELSPGERCTIVLRERSTPLGTSGVCEVTTDPILNTLQFGVFRSGGSAPPGFPVYNGGVRF